MAGWHTRPVGPQDDGQRLQKLQLLLWALLGVGVRAEGADALQGEVLDGRHGSPPSNSAGVGRAGRCRESRRPTIRETGPMCSPAPPENNGPVNGPSSSPVSPFEASDRGGLHR